jgi:hypothetical protein
VIFNFVLSNHHESSLNSLGDLLEPIYLGLEACGHHVIRYSRSFHAAPMINVLIEFFTIDSFVEDLLRMKRDHGEGFRLGLLCTEDPEDWLAMDVFPNRRPNLERLASISDFIWTLLPVEDYYRSLCEPSRIGRLKYGFIEEYLDPDIVTDPRHRDLDVLLYGNAHPYRETVVRALDAAGINCMVTAREVFPDFAATDLVRRSKILLDVRRSPDVRYLSPTRIVRGLHAGTAVVSERYDEGPLADLYEYTVACRYEELVTRCTEIIRGGRYVDLGLSALEKFRAATSMRENVAAALSLPVFGELGAG